ncbi:MAG: AAA family ATPase, partial [Nanopusillaceae archaeon]
MVNIELKSMSISNFKKIDEFEYSIDGDKSICLIKGPNGSGKSSIFEAMYTCLYGSKSGLTDQEVIQKNKSSCDLQLKLLINNEVYTIDRTIGKVNKLVVKKNDETISDKPSTSKPIIESLIPEFLFKMSMLEIRSKNEIKTLIKEIISSILDIDKFMNMIKNKLNDVSSEITSLNNDITRLSTTYENYQSAITNNQNRKENLINEINNYNTEIKKIETQLESITLDYIIELKSKIEKAFNNKYNSVKESYLNELNKHTQVANELNGKIQSLISNKDKILSEAKSKKLEIDHKFDIDISKINSDISLINNKISYIQKQILELDSQLKQDRCPVCKQIITEETKQVIRDQIKSYEEEISNYNNQITNLKNSIDVLLLEKTNELEKVKLEYSNKYTEIDNQIKLETVNLEDVNKKIKDTNNSINMIDTNKLYQEVLDE